VVTKWLNHILNFLKWLLYGSFKINKNYACDWLLFWQFRKYSDGITFFELNINLDRYEGDHNPKFSIRFALLNCYIFQLEVYNVNHVE
jgi:hypothetical protein